MVPLLHLFEFSYANGFLFFDRSGALSIRLQGAFPGLAYKNSAVDQRDFVRSTDEIDLFFGIAVSRIQSFAPFQPDFPSVAGDFLRVVVDEFQIEELKEFRFRYVLGRPCGSVAEARSLLWPLVPEETKSKLASLAEPIHWQALQAEFTIGNLACQSRFAVLDLPVHRSQATAKIAAGKVVPHITCHLDFRGFAPVAVSEFDAVAFMTNVRQKHTDEIISKLAPHLVDHDFTGTGT